MTSTRIIFATVLLAAPAHAQDTSDQRKGFQSATSGSTFSALQSRRSDASTNLNILGFAKSETPTPSSEVAQKEAKPTPPKPARDRPGRADW